MDTSLLNANISQKGSVVNPQYSLSDSDGNQLSDGQQKHKRYGRWNVYAKDVLLDKGIAPVEESSVTEEVAPVTEDESEEVTEATEDLFPDAPMENLDEDGKGQRLALSFHAGQSQDSYP